MNTLTTQVIIKRDDGTTGLPSLTMPTLTGVDTFTTPSVSVPPNDNNPYIIRQSNPTGTVFIAVGAIVGAILLGFILYHLIISLTASRVAKKGVANDKQLYEKYQYNNNTAYGGNAGYAASVLTPSTSNFGNDLQQSISRLHSISPSKSLMFGNHHQNYAGSQMGDNSTIYNSEPGAATSKHDLTKMFISPTAEVMSHKRIKSGQFGGSTANVSMYGGSGYNGSAPNLVNTANSRLSQVPNLYINNDFNNSEYSLSVYQQQQQQILQQQQQQQESMSNVASPQTAPRSTRKTVPSMYLEDLIDNEGKE
ncbi:hypothetical protein DFJ63DRAFT_332704 [Scheffersomyces coipomensis]|uniref:uncharacterized protein n=1 Tax=Scheffersomyces coipomensis TaxID=1788519 RepID=UPI00315DA490